MSAARAAAAVGARMHAWRVHAYGGPAELKLDSARVPALRAPDDVLVRVLAASVNPLDVAMIGGYGARVLGALRGLEGDAGGGLPLLGGRDCCGEVVAAGATARLRRGQRVWGVVPPHRPGTHAEYVLLKDRWAGPAPRSLDALQAGGALYAALSASAALRCAGLPPDRPARARVLLLGLGGVGQAALQLLAHAGAQVVVGCAAELLPLARELGAVLALDRGAADYGRRLEAGGPYGAVLDCAGIGGEAAARWRPARFVTLSSPLLRLTDATGLLGGAARAVGALAAQSAAAGGAVRWAFFWPRAGDLELLRRLAERGRFSVRVQCAFPWREARVAYAQLARGGARGKLLLDFTAPQCP